jgi:hypothetical protein
VKVRFVCPVCEVPAQVLLSAPVEWQCPACEQRLRLEAPPADLPHCAVCGNSELYKKKDFPHWLGMLILTGACVASVFTYAFYEKWLTWAILIGSAVFDGLLYLWVKDALVCYRCNAHYSGGTATDAHKPFELQIGERYRQERIRREQLTADGKTRS